MSQKEVLVFMCTIAMSQPNAVRNTHQTRFRKMRFFDAESEFRNSFVYSNLMYGLATYISERLAGRSWEQLLREEIFNPLNMTSTTFTHVANLSRPDIMTPYLLDGTSWKPVSLLLHKYGFC